MEYCLSLILCTYAFNNLLGNYFPVTTLFALTYNDFLSVCCTDGVYTLSISKDGEVPLSRHWGLNAIILMLRTRDFSLLIAITEHRLRFNHRTISNKFVLSFQTWCQRWVFLLYIIHFHIQVERTGNEEMSC